MTRTTIQTPLRIGTTFEIESISLRDGTAVLKHRMTGKRFHADLVPLRDRPGESPLRDR